MADDSKIEWTDATWNPVTGCEKVSPGCDHCYAETFAERWRDIPGHYFENGFSVQLRPGKLEQPLRWQRPRRVFVNSMSDLFHKDVPDEYIACAFVIMAATPRHTYQLLTKRHARMKALLSSDEFQAKCFFAAASRGLDLEGAPWPLPNVWLGVSAEDQHWANLRVPALLHTPAAVRFVSAEPLLGPLGLRPGEWLPPLGGGPRANLSRPWEAPGPALDWVIIGGESGPGARPMGTGWAQWLALQVKGTGTPVFVKQLGSALGKELGAGPKGGDWDAWPEDLRVREYPREVGRAR